MTVLMREMVSGSNRGGVGDSHSSDTMRKEPLIEPDVNPFPAALGSPSQLMPALYMSSPCKLTVVEHSDISFYQMGH